MGLAAIAVIIAWMAHVIATPVPGEVELLGRHAAREAGGLAWIMWALAVMAALVSLILFWLAGRPFPPVRQTEGPETQRLGSDGVRSRNDDGAFKATDDA
ncbi:MAG TPA: hypothetical protein VFE62_00495 [Gemmataceae bacterium]|nr:hypothetical protein [Gemmataceae bacterium]